MYALLHYGLIVLAVIAFAFSLLGLLPFSVISLGILIVCLIASTYIVNYIFARLFKATVNYESYIITALILFFILAPVTNVTDALVALAAGTIAMASKYLLAIRKKHIFNPAAFAAFLLGLLGFGNEIWWVGSLILLPFVTVFGLLVVRKIRRFQLFLPFLAVAVVTICLFNMRNGLSMQESITQVFSSWPIMFFGTIMLTEPLTTPPRKKWYMSYAALVGVLFGVQFEIGPLFASPEFALVVGNLYSYIVSPKYKLFLSLTKRHEIGSGMYEFIFAHKEPFIHHPGQYLEWTVPQVHADFRGNRRYFTIASSPTEKDIKIGVRIGPEHSSSFKKKLLAMKEGEEIVASQLSGDFILPDDTAKKLVFIAGGIGVTPFRSMIKYLLDKKEKRDIVFFYACSQEGEFVYRDLLAEAEKELGITVVYVITRAENAPANWKGMKGRLTADDITKYVSEAKDRTYYLSGPNAMVEGYKSILHTLGVPLTSVVTDYFPGF